MQTIKLELPVHWAVALVNSDESGLSRRDVRELNAFVADMVESYGQCWCVDVSEESWFRNWHDATCYGVLACDVADFVFDVTPGAAQ